MGTMAVVDSTGLQLSGVAVASVSCADVSSGLDAVKSTFGLTTVSLPTACSSDPVAPNTSVIFQKDATPNNFVAFHVTQISAPTSYSLDYTSMGLIWTFGFTTVVLLWIISRTAGTVLEAIRRF
jgi:hypothetical protein